MGSSPLRTGPLAVLNRYQVSPSLAIEGSCVYSTSPSTCTTCADILCGALFFWPWAGAMVKRVQARKSVVLFRIASTFRMNQAREIFGRCTIAEIVYWRLG